MRVATQWYPSTLLTAVVAAVFSVVVCGLLWADFARRSLNDPLDSTEYLTLKEQLREQPGSEDVQEKIRSLDLRLRREYFRQRQFTVMGAYLLLGGVSVTLLAGRVATTLKRKLPQPTSSTLPEDRDSRVTQTGLWALAVLAAVLVAATLGLSLGQRSSLPGSLAELASLSQAGKPESPEGGSETDSSSQGSDPTAPAAANAVELPTPEEYLQSWPRFRGPRGDGVSAYSDVPTTWDVASGEGIVWKSPVPLPGNGSPVVWQDLVFLSGATEERREVYCFDAKTGNQLWKREVAGDAQPDSKPLEVNEDTGYAASTTATDGRRVFAIFAVGQLAAFDFAGNPIWSRSFGVPDNPYGHASSLATYRDRLIVQLDQGSKNDDKSRLMALDASTGETVWEVPREVPSSWSSPIVVEHADQPRVITATDPWVTAYSPEDGSEIWRAKCLRQDVGPSPVYWNGIVYTANEFPCLSAIADGGEGDVTESHVKWTADFGLPDTSTPLITNEFVLLLASYGTLTCYDISGGEDPLWEEDFEDEFCSSPSLVDNHVYLFGVSGKAWIVQPQEDQCELIAEADLGEECVTSPAFQAGRIYIRGAEHLFCIGASQEP